MNTVMTRLTSMALVGVVCMPLTLSAEDGAAEPPMEAVGRTLESAPPSYRWRVSGGVIFRSLDRVSFRSGDLAGASAVPYRFPGDAALNLAPVGDTVSVANREYDDGFVRLDPSTLNNGDTWYWGYEDASQVAGSDRISFQRDLGVSQDRGFADRLESGDWGDSGIDGLGFFAQAERAVCHTKGVTFSIVANLSGARFDAAKTSSRYSAEQRFSSDAVTLTDTFDLMGIDPPNPPYAGTYDGPGPLLPNIPISRMVERTPLRRASCDYVNAVREGADIDLLTFGLGVSGTLEVNRLGFAAAVGPTLNLVHMDATYDETLSETCGGVTSVVGHWQAEDSNDDVKVGAFCQAEASLAVTGRMRVGLFGRYDWLDAVDGEVGPSRYDVDASGFSGGAVLTWEK